MDIKICRNGESPGASVTIISGKKSITVPAPVYTKISRIDDTCEYETRYKGMAHYQCGQIEERWNGKKGENASMNDLKIFTDNIEPEALSQIYTLR